MADTPSTSVNPVTSRPLQRISWNEKTKDKHDWFKRCADWYISLANFNFDGNNRKDLRLLYQIYNSKFPARWFNHVTDPLNARNPNHKKWPGKIRPMNILRTNIDLLLGEYPRRPFVFQVQNLGESGYNSYLEQLHQKLNQNITDHFVAQMQEQAAAMGLPIEEVPGLEEVELPEAVKEKFTTSYKDREAIRGQKWLTRAMKEYRIKDELTRCFKDYLITGFTYTYKAVENSSVVYERVSPIAIDYDKSPDLEYIEDGEWVVRRRLMTLSDIVDHFYEDITASDMTSLEMRSHMQTPTAFFQYMSEVNYNHGTAGKIPVYHVVWKGKKPVKLLSYPDPVTGEIQEMQVDEDYPVDSVNGETAETIWVNEVYECWRLGNDIYVRPGPIKAQRNALNNFSVCKLPYNGRAFSDVHSESISPMEMGLPYLIMYIITNRTLEGMISKNKGKILLMDKQAIPRTDGWDDEKFFYYSEALGYGLLNRNQQGVDKTWNQYQVVDMSLFDQIKQLIDLQAHYKQEWDDILGINRPRKGATYASDGKAVSEMGLMQSSVITDSIFNSFEMFTERELQGLLDLSKFVNVEGLRRMFNTGEMDMDLIDLNPDTYASAELGVLVNSSVQEQAVFEELKRNMGAFAQAGTKPSVILEMLRTKNVAELSEKLRKIEELQAAMEQQTYSSQEELEAAADERKRQFAEFENILKGELLNKEWDRRDQNEMIKGEYQLNSFGGDGDNDDDGVPDALEIEDRIIQRQRNLEEARIKREEGMRKERMHERDLSFKEKELKAKERMAQEKNKTDIRKARSKPKN